MLKKFLKPDWKRLIIYLVFVLIFMSETLLIRYLYKKDYIVEFFLNIYNHFFKGMKDYVNFFTLTFFCYLLVLFVLYLLSCLVILIYEKIEK